MMLPAAAFGQMASSRTAAPAPPVYTTSVGDLDAVTAISATNAWAVGETLFGAQVFIVHWNGTAWTRFPAPVLRGGAGLSAVAASSPRNVWAVGDIGRRTLILHFNGSRWVQVPSPSPFGSAWLNAVAVTKSGAAWAVGGYGPPHSGAQALILGWSRGKWRQETLPDPGNPALDGADLLTGVAASSAASGWAVGLGDPGYWTTFARWQRTQWQVAPSPNIEDGTLYDVALAPRGEAWAVGHLGGGPLIMHLTGSSWRRVQTPRSASGAWLNAVAVSPDGTAWAVGQVNNSDRVAVGAILQWTGQRWHAVPVPAVSAGGSAQAILTGVTALSSGDAWAVGTDGYGSFLLRWNGGSW